jgi:hypothetical protein
MAAAVLAGLLPAMLSSGLVTLPRIAELCADAVWFCFHALTTIDDPLHWFPFLLLGAGVLRAAKRRVGPAWRALGGIRRYPQRALCSTDPIHPLCVRHELEQRTRILLGDPPVHAFTAGFLRPTIYVSERLQRELAPDELESVVLHEGHHLRARDPGRCALATLVADLLFWLPLARAGAERFLLRVELIADDAAAARPTSLARAIVKVASLTMPARPPRAALALAGSREGQLELRVKRLLGAAGAELPPWPRRTLLTSGLAVLLLWLVGLGASVSHSLHEAGHPRDATASEVGHEPGEFGSPHGPEHMPRT